ncbi:TPA: hypothetical protein ACXKGF_005023 [Escherichia coli]
MKKHYIAGIIALTFAGTVGAQGIHDTATRNDATGGGWYHNGGDQDPSPSAQVTGDIVLSKNCSLTMTNSTPTATIGPYARGGNTYVSTVTMSTTCDGLNLVAWFNHDDGQNPQAIKKSEGNAAAEDKYIKLTVAGVDWQRTLEAQTKKPIYVTKGAPGAGVNKSFDIRLAEDIGHDQTGVFTYTIDGRIAIA